MELSITTDKNDIFVYPLDPALPAGVRDALHERGAGHGAPYVATVHLTVPADGSVSARRLRAGVARLECALVGRETLGFLGGTALEQNVAFERVRVLDPSQVADPSASSSASSASPEEKAAAEKQKKTVPSPEEDPSSPATPLPPYGGSGSSSSASADPELHLEPGKQYSWDVVFDIPADIAPYVRCRYGRLYYRLTAKLTLHSAGGRLLGGGRKTLKASKNAFPSALPTHDGALEYVFTHAADTALGPLWLTARSQHLTVGGYMRLGLVLPRLPPGAQLVRITARLLQRFTLCSRKRPGIKEHCPLESHTLVDSDGSDLVWRSDPNAALGCAVHGEWVTKLPVDHVFRPTSLPGSQSAIKVAHQMVCQIRYTYSPPPETTRTENMASRAAQSEISNSDAFSPAPLPTSASHSEASSPSCSRSHSRSRYEPPPPPQSQPKSHSRSRGSSSSPARKSGKPVVQVYQAGWQIDIPSCAAEYDSVRLPSYSALDAQPVPSHGRDDWRGPNEHEDQTHCACGQTLERLLAVETRVAQELGHGLTLHQAMQKEMEDCLNGTGAAGSYRDSSRRGSRSRSHSRSESAVSRRRAQGRGESSRSRALSSRPGGSAVAREPPAQQHTHALNTPQGPDHTSSPSSSSRPRSPSRHPSPSPDPRLTPNELRGRTPRVNWAWSTGGNQGLQSVQVQMGALHSGMFGPASDEERDEQNGNGSSSRTSLSSLDSLDFEEESDDDEEERSRWAHKQAQLYQIVPPELDDR